MDRVEDCISFLVGKAAQQITRQAREKLAGRGVTPTQYALLKVLWGDDGQSAAQLTNRLLIDSATITGVIDRLEAAELIERRCHGEDRRVNLLFVTERGKALQASLDAAMDELNREVTQEIGDQAPALWAALRRLGQPCSS